MPIKVKNNDKCNEWEKRRRERLNEAFKNLSQILPHYDPAKVETKIDILEKATEFVKELRLSNSRLLSTQAGQDEKCKLIKELQDETNRLILRVKQLTLLLKKAEITIPTGPEIKSLGSRRPKWAGKLTPEDIENHVVLATQTQNLPGEKSSDKPSQEKAQPSTSPPSPASSSTSPPTAVQNDVIRTNSDALSNPGVASIIVPLREANSSKPEDERDGATHPPESSPLSLTSPLSSAATKSPQLSKNISSVVSTAPTPAPVITSIVPKTTLLPSEPIFTTTTAPIQFPLQTFILAPCPITTSTTAVSAGQQPQIITRFANLVSVGPPTILPKPLDGVSFQKIPIKPVLKPVPKVVHRRRKRSKKNQAESPEVAPKKSKNEVDTISPEKSQDKQPEIPPPSSTGIKDKSTASDDKTEKISSEDEQASKIIPPEAPEQQLIENQVDEGAANKADIAPDISAPEVAQKQPLPEPSKQILEENNDATKPVESLPNLESTQQEQEPSTDNIPVLRIIERPVEEAPYNESSNVTILSIVVVVESEEVLKGSEDKSSLEPSSGESEPIVLSENVQFTQEEGPIRASLGAEKVQTDTPVPAEEPRIETINSQPIVDTSHVEVESETIHAVLEPVTHDKPEKRNFPDTFPLEEVHQPASVTIKASVVAIPVTSSIDNLSTHISKDITAVITEKGLSSSNIHALEQTSTTSELALPIPTSSSAATHLSLSTLSLLEKPKESENQEKSISTTDKSLNESVTTTDKISECIARSIDLIDANDSELMELGEHWEDTGGSPKSPISPTQMFLNIFPLLPRESSLADHPSHPQPTLVAPHNTPAQYSNKSSTSTLQQFNQASSNSRSSFFIDAMLPDEHTTSGTINSDSIDIIPSSSSQQTPCLALTPPQFSSSSSQQISSPFSLSNHYYWTPTPSSCGIDGNNDFRLPSFQASNQRHTSENTPPRSYTNVGITPITTKISTSPPAVSSTSFYTLASTATVTLSSPSKSTTTLEDTRSSKKSSGTTSTSTISRQPKSLNFDIPFPSFSKPIKSTNVVTVTTSTTTTLSATSTITTWTITAPSQSIASTCSTNQSQSVTQLDSQIHHQHSTCSILDSLNPIDASFFRPLLNALDDLRSLDFPAAPLPAPPLPPLIPPPPHSSKPLYTPQFNPNSHSQPIQNPLSVNYHHTTATIGAPHTSHHEQSPVTSILHQPPPPIISSQPSTLINTPEVSTATHKKLNPPQHPTPSAPQHPPSTHHQETTSKNSKRDTSEKTSRTSGRQKAESTRQSRSGKSSRTQPYLTPSSTSQPEPRSQVHVSSGTSASKAVSTPQVITAAQGNTHTNLFLPPPPPPTSQHIQPAITPVAPRSYNFHTQNILDSNNYESGGPSGRHAYHVPQQYPSTTPNPTPTPVQTTTKTGRSTSESSKVTKSKADKPQASHVSNKSRSQPAPLFPQQTPHSASSFQNQNVSTSQSSSSAPTQATSQLHSQPQQAPVQPSKNNLQTNQNQLPHTIQMPYQSSTESFQLFPEYSGGHRQTNTYHHVHNQYQESIIHSHRIPHQDQMQQDFSHNFGAQRGHPYYLPEITSSFDNFSSSAHHHVHHPQPPASQAQQMQAPATRQVPTSAGTGAVNSTSANNSKFIYGAINNNSGNMNTPQQPSASTAGNSRAHQHHNTYSQAQQQPPPQPRQQQHPLIQSATSTNTSQISHSQIGHAHAQPRTNQTHHVHHEPTQQQASISSSKSNKNMQPPPQPQPPPPPQPAFQPAQSQVQHHIHHHHCGHQQQQQQSVPPPHQHNQTPAGRPSSSRTVNWMTDTGYRTGGSSNVTPSAEISSTSNNKQRQSVSASNPFSVSKLVGITSAPVPPNKAPAPHVNMGGPPGGPSREQQQQSSASNATANNTNRNTKSSATNNAQNAGTSAVSNNSGASATQNQSNYCAEALIRKNPASDWNDFHLVQPTPANHGFHSYPSSHTQHGTVTHQHHNSSGVDNFSNYPGQYHYPQQHFEHHHHHHSHTQPFQSHHHGHTHSNQNLPSTSTATTSAYQSSTPAAPQHNMSQVQVQPQSSHQQIQYPSHHHHHHHHQYSHHPSQHPAQGHHSSSTSSVTNFNLSTIFPEINDKRSNTNNATGSTSTTSVQRVNNSGVCGYQHHPGFGDSRSATDNLHQ